MLFRLSTSFVVITFKSSFTHNVGRSPMVSSTNSAMAVMAVGGSLWSDAPILMIYR